MERDWCSVCAYWKDRQHPNQCNLHKEEDMGTSRDKALEAYADSRNAVQAQIEGAPLPNAQGTGMKYDGGKPRWSLMMRGLPNFLEGIAKVLTFGANKYAADSWKGVPEGYERYRDALYRHLNAIERGEKIDPESGLPHWHHVGCNAGFCSEFDNDRT